MNLFILMLSFQTKQQIYIFVGSIN